MTKQLLHLVFGGELTDLNSHLFQDISALDIVGIFPNYAQAHQAWKAAAHKTVDNAHMRYFIVHLHRLMDPNQEQASQEQANQKQANQKQEGQHEH